MIKFKNYSIYNKIVAVALSMVFLLGILSAAVIWDSLNTMMDEQLQKRGAEIGNHIASLSTNHILVDDRYALYELLHEIKTNNKDVRYIFVTDYNGRLMAHTFPDGIPKGLAEINSPPFKPETRVLHFNSNEGTIRDILVPVEGGAVGYIRVGITEELTRGIIGKTLEKFALIILTVSSIAMLLAAKMARMITLPISALVRVSRDIARGNLAAKAAVNTNDEIGILAASFDEMASSLAETNRERDGLVEMLREKEQLRATLLSKVITAQEDERRRISRELHDETGQALTSLVVSMRALAGKAADEKQRELLLGARDVAANVLREIRDMAVELRPPVLDDLGLVAAIKKYIANYQERFGIMVQFAGDELTAVDRHMAVALYRIMQESLTNILKHSQATAATLTLSENAGSVTMKIEDNGRGVTGTELEQALRENRIGIYGMKERAELLGGSFELSSFPRTGTVITVNIPISQERTKKNDHSHCFGRRS